MMYVQPLFLTTWYVLYTGAQFTKNVNQPTCQFIKPPMPTVEMSANTHVHANSLPVAAAAAAVSEPKYTNNLQLTAFICCTVLLHSNVFVHGYNLPRGRSACI